VSRSRFLLKGLLKLCLAAACLVAAIAAYRLLVHPVLESALSLSSATSSVVRRIGILAAAVLSYGGFVRLAERRALPELGIRWGWTLLAAAAGAASIGVTILALYVTGHYQVVAVPGLGLAWDVLGTLTVAAVLEEVAFRGILFRLLEERLGTRAAWIASALVFSVAHLANNGVGWVTPLTVMLAGLMWAGVFILSRNLWVTAAHHLCWNATIFAIGLPLSGEADVRAKAPIETIVHGSALWTGGEFGPEDSLINVVVSSLICIALWRLALRPGREAGP